MPVPVWSVITDSEIDQESPATSSLFFRLRDNILALLGVDPATASPLVAGFPSVAEIGNSAFVTFGSYMKIMTLPLPLPGEHVVVVGSPTYGQDELGLTGITASFTHVAAGTSRFGITVGDISIVLDGSGVPTHVRLVSKTFLNDIAGAVPIAITSSVANIYDLAINNTDVELVRFNNSPNSVVSARAYADSAGVYVRFTETGGISTHTSHHAVHKYFTR